MFACKNTQTEWNERICVRFACLRVVRRQALRDASCTIVHIFIILATVTVSPQGMTQNSLLGAAQTAWYHIHIYARIHPVRSRTQTRDIIALVYRKTDMILKHRKTKNKKCSRPRTGLTLVEIAIAITILTLIGSAMFLGFHNLLSRQTLGQINEDVVSFLQETREKTIGRESGFSYGIHVTESELVRFRGSPFIGDAPSKQKNKNLVRFLHSDI